VEDKFKVFGVKVVIDVEGAYGKDFEGLSNSPDVVSGLQEKSKVE
jgi:hypothetical protein